MKITHGKTFRTRAGKTGHYEYHNGRKVKFVTTHSGRRNHRFSKRRF